MSEAQESREVRNGYVEMDWRREYPEGYSPVVDLNEAEAYLVSPKVPGIYNKSLALASENPSKVRVQLARIQPGHRFPEHWHPYPQMFYFLEGRGHVNLDGLRVPVYPGRVVRLFKGERHEVVNDGEQDLLLLEVAVPDANLKVHQ